jgi:hypothetical protein
MKVGFILSRNVKVAFEKKTLFSHVNGVDRASSVPAVVMRSLNTQHTYHSDLESCYATRSLLPALSEHLIVLAVLLASNKTVQLK